MSRKPQAEGANHPTDAAQTKAVYVEMPPALHQRFKAACAARGSSMTERIISFIENDTASARTANVDAAVATH